MSSSLLKDFLHVWNLILRTSLKILLIKRWGNKKFKLLINTVNKNVQDLWGINENTVLQIKVSGQLSRYLEKNKMKLFLFVSLK